MPIIDFEIPIKLYQTDYGAPALLDYIANYKGLYELLVSTGHFSLSSYSEADPSTAPESLHLKDSTAYEDPDAGINKVVLDIKNTSHKMLLISQRLLPLIVVSEQNLLDGWGTMTMTYENQTEYASKMSKPVRAFTETEKRYTKFNQLFMKGRIIYNDYYLAIYEYDGNFETDPPLLIQPAYYHLFDQQGNFYYFDYFRVKAEDTTECRIGLFTQTFYEMNALLSLGIGQTQLQDILTNYMYRNIVFTDGQTLKLPVYITKINELWDKNKVVPDMIQTFVKDYPLHSFVEIDNERYTPHINHIAGANLDNGSNMLFIKV